MIFSFGVCKTCDAGKKVNSYANTDGVRSYNVTSFAFYVHFNGEAAQCYNPQRIISYWLLLLLY